MEIRLRDGRSDVLLTLKDNGRGFDPEKVERRVGHGLVNMRDRARALGGELTLTSSGEQGTEVSVSLPKHGRTQE